MSRVSRNLLAAVDKMRSACDEAERAAAGGDSVACQRVVHALAWGFANASSSVECAMAAVEENHEREKSNQEKTQ